VTALIVSDCVNCNDIILLVESKTWVVCETRQLARGSRRLFLVCWSVPAVLETLSIRVVFSFSEVPHDTAKSLVVVDVDVDVFQG
jgi:hypothetical protein